MWQTITAIAVPMLTVLIGLVRGGGDSRLSRRIAHHIEILNSLEKHIDAAAKMQTVIELELDALAERERARQARRLNKANLSLAIILGLGTAATTWGLTSFITAHGRDPYAWVGITLISVAVFFVAILTIAGIGTIYAPVKEKPSAAPTASED